jgi:predicted nuclease with TOPRIM domain
METGLHTKLREENEEEFKVTYLPATMSHLLLVVVSQSYKSQFNVDMNENIKNGEGTIEDHALCDYVMNRNREELKSLRSKLAACRREYLELEERYEKLSDEHGQCPYWLQRREDQAMTAMEKLEEITQGLEEAENGRCMCQNH